MNKLNKLRTEKNMYEKDIAKLINVSQNTYSQYETETLDLPLDILIKLANIFNVSIDYILGLTEIRDPYPKTKIIKSNEIFTRLREIRENYDFNQKDIAKILNKSPRGYGLNENKNNEPSTTDLKKLALFYNVSVDYILYLTDCRKPYKRTKEMEKYE